jgi:hypothetical protein
MRLNKDNSAINCVKPTVQHKKRFISVIYVILHQYLNKVRKGIGLDRYLHSWNICTFVCRDSLNCCTAPFQYLLRHMAPSCRLPKRLLVGQLFSLLGSWFCRGVGFAADVEILFTLDTAFRKGRVWMPPVSGWDCGVPLYGVLVQYWFHKVDWWSCI